MMHGFRSPLAGEHARLWRAEGGLDASKSKDSFFVSPPSLSLPLKGGGENERQIRRYDWVLCSVT
jgi:hypothetical protein